MSQYEEKHKKSGSKVKSIIMYIALQERQKRDLTKYEVQVNEYKKMSSNEQDLYYINLKTRYEHKKNVLLAFMVTVIVAILAGIWKWFYQFGERALEYIMSINSVNAEYTQISITFFLIVTIVVSIILIFIIIAYIHSMRKMYKDLLVIENIRQKCR